MPVPRTSAVQRQWSEPLDGFSRPGGLLTSGLSLTGPSTAVVGAYEALEQLSTYASRAHALTCCPCGADHSADLMAHKLSLSSMADIAGRATDGSPESANVTISGEVGNTTGSAASISLGDTVFSQIETAGDQDWFAVTLQAGVTYEFTLSGTGGGPLDDPFLELMNSGGTQVAENDDGGSGLNSLLRYTPSTTGTYYLNAHHFGSGTGAYALTANQAQPLPTYSISQIANYLVSEGSSGGRSWGPDALTYDIEALTNEQRVLAERALQVWSAVTPLTFTRVTGGGNITFTNVDPSPDGPSAYAQNSFSGSTITSSTVVITSDWQSGNTAYDSYTQQTYIHEVGHALGLGHAGPYNGTATYGTDNIYTNDNWAYTVMSYFDQAEAGHGSYRFVLGLQQADIAAIQQLYGARPGGTFAGNTTFGFNSSAPGTNIDWSQFVLVQAEGTYRRPPSMTIYDTSGVDTINLSGFSQPQILDLRPGTFSSLGDRPSASQPNYTNVIAIEASTIIENAIGGKGNDRITGNFADNRLSGGDGVELSSVGGQVYRLYLGALGREPDPISHHAWIAQLNSGQTTFNNVVNGFITSIEFQARYGQPDNGQLVTLLYNNVLGRGPDTDGFNGWVNALNSGTSRVDVVRGFTDSAELIDRTAFSSQAYAINTFNPDAEGKIFRLYQAALARAPDPASFVQWVQLLHTDAAEYNGIIPGFINSVEFQSRYGALNNSQFVTLLYNNVLGRAPDPIGLQGWIDLLNSGTSRADVVGGFSESTEFINATRASFFNFMQTASLGWSDTLDGDSGSDWLFGGRGADTFLLNLSETGSKIIYGLQSYDSIRIEGFSSVNQFTSALVQQGADAVFSLGGLTVRFAATTVGTVISTTQIGSGAEVIDDKDIPQAEDDSPDIALAELIGAAEASSPSAFDFSYTSGSDGYSAGGAPLAGPQMSSAAVEWAGMFEFTGSAPAHASEALTLPKSAAFGSTGDETDLISAADLPAGFIPDTFDFSTLDRPLLLDWA